MRLTVASIPTAKSLDQQQVNKGRFKPRPQVRHVTCLQLIIPHFINTLKAEPPSVVTCQELTCRWAVPRCNNRTKGEGPRSILCCSRLGSRVTNLDWVRLI